MSERVVGLNGRDVRGDERKVLSELAFEHYPVCVDAGEGERDFPSFDAAREYISAMFAETQTSGD